MASKGEGTRAKVPLRRGEGVGSGSPLTPKEKQPEDAKKPARRRSAASAAPSVLLPKNAAPKSTPAAKRGKSARAAATTDPAMAAAKPPSPAAATAAAAKRDAGKRANAAASPTPASASRPAPKSAALDAKQSLHSAPQRVGQSAPTRASNAQAGIARDAEAAAPAAGAAFAPGGSADGQIEATFAQFLPGGGVMAQQMAENLERIEVLCQRLTNALAARQGLNAQVEMPGPDLYVTAANSFWKTLTEQPGRIIEQQVNYWGDTLKHYVRAQAALANGGAPEDEDLPQDKRFANPLWRSNPFFSYVRHQYEINARAMSAAAADLELPDETARRRVKWLTGQVIDMMAPTNFLATNPDALERAVETEGESLVRGLENLVRDIEQNGGEMLVSLADRDAFVLGENIGTTEGTVVHRTPLVELIQYKPTTQTVHKLPLVIFPPWINKFYILDLKPQNSLIRWLVDQGHSLFVVSWKNPDPSYADTGMDDYVSAYLEVFEKVLALTGEKKLNVVGYCIAGTTLSLTLALMAKRGDRRVNSATFFTTLTDFSDQGEFTTFLQDDFVDGIEVEVAREGVLRSQFMSRTMSFLRANDLVWGPAIRSYMMGEAPPAFDLLFWNGDSTNLPARMAVEYLRGLCQQNAFARDGFQVMGEKVRLQDVTVPLMAVACESDHIAPWKDCWRGVAQMGSTQKRFVLSESGHVAGIVNPPSKKKYGHYDGGSDFSHGHEAWKSEAQFNPGSWWPLWGDWLAGQAGDKVPSREPGKGYGPAPGDYVLERGGLKRGA